MGELSPNYTEDIAPSALGKLKLTDIRRYHVQEFVNDQTKAGRGTVTVRRLVTLLGTIFAGAVKDELISVNPTGRGQAQAGP
ncbi:MAG TPA: hypothetical protein VF086_17200 [Propionibacteriaceae bacterium]